MPGERALATPSVIVNNDIVAILPNSLVIKTGKGNKMVRPQSAGGDSVSNVITEDAETKKSMVKFSMYNTKTATDLLADWQSSTDGVSIQVSERKSSYQANFRRMHVIEDPEIALSADGNLEINFEGQPSI